MEPPHRVCSRTNKPWVNVLYTRTLTKCESWEVQRRSEGDNERDSRELNELEMRGDRTPSIGRSWRLISSHRDRCFLPAFIPARRLSVLSPPLYALSGFQLWAFLTHTYLYLGANARARTPRLLSAPLLFLLFTLLELSPRQANSNSPLRILFRVLSSCCACTSLPAVISRKYTCFVYIWICGTNEIIDQNFYSSPSFVHVLFIYIVIIFNYLSLFLIIFIFNLYIIFIFNYLSLFLIILFFVYII